MNNIDPPLNRHSNSTKIKTIIKEDLSNLNDWLLEFSQHTKLVEQELFNDLGFDNLSLNQMQEIKEYIKTREFSSFEESKQVLSEVFAYWISKC